MPYRSARSIWLAAAVFLAPMLRALWIATGGEARITTSLPDDAFYYFVLAKHHATIGRWTFDGVAPATGFHLLWGYILSGIYRTADCSLLTIFLLSSLIGAASMAVASWALSRIVLHDYGWTGGAAILLCFIGGGYSLLPTMAMEAPLVIMFAALCAYAVLGKQPVLALLAGLFGELARSDFGLVPFALLAAAVLVSGTVRDKRAPAWGCAGALIGLCCNFAHTYLIAGHLLQNSVLIKSYWSALAGNPIAPALLMIGDMFYLGSGVIGLLLFILFAAASALDARRSVQRLTLWVASAIIAICYILLYRNNSQEIQPWYLASFTLPAIFFSAGALRLLNRHLGRAALGGTVVALASPTLISCTRPIYPHMLLMAEAGKEFAQSRERVGAWNAGVIGYYNYDRTVNLDGLVNDEILPYAKTGDLLRYVERRKIGTVADFGIMLNPSYSLRGGYSDGKFAACLAPVRTIEIQNVTPWRGTPLTVYHVQCGPKSKLIRRISLTRGARKVSG